MAYMCIRGNGECDGCGRCREREPEYIGNCEHCSDVIYDDEDYYDIDGVLLHEDCLKDWADEYKRKAR